MLGSGTILPYTGSEAYSDQPVYVWVLDPAIGSSRFDELWFKSYDDAAEHCEDNIAEAISESLEVSRIENGASGDEAEVEYKITIRKRIVTAEEAAAVFAR